MDCVLVVVEPSHDSLEVARRIKEMANQIEIADAWAILNKVTTDEIATKLTGYLAKKDIAVIGSIDQDAEIFKACLEGRPIDGRMVGVDVDQILDFLFP